MAKSITLGILLLAAIAARAQDTVYNRFSLDVQFGANNPTTPMSPGYDAPTLGMFHAGLGARYMFTQRFGLRLGLGYDMLGERKGTPEFSTNYYSASLEGVANLGKMFHFKQRVFGLLLHAGLGYSLMDGEENAAADVNHIAHGVIGLTPQFRLGERVNLYVDAAMKAHVYQQYTYDFQRSHNQTGVDGYLYNLSIGLQFNLGPHARHADWAMEDFGNQAAINALQNRVNQLEQAHRDDDGDGVANYLDEEPGTPPGTKVDTKGRTVVEEARDSDSDNIPDDVDDCPFEKGTPGNRGCPQASSSTGGSGTASASTRAMIEGSEVKFPTDEATISPAFASMLDGIVGVMKDNPSYNLNIVGHADDRASNEYNMALSQRRADAVRSYMISKGVDGSRLTTTAKGESQPKVNATTVEARAENRRVQFILK